MILDKNLLLDNYNGNIFDLAAELRVSVQTIMASFKKHNIPFDKPKHLYSELKKTNFSKFQKSLLLGSILGDGHLEKRSKLKNALFREEHSIKQIEWLKWKYTNLKPFITSKLWIRDRGKRQFLPDGKGGKKLYNVQKICSISTGVHPYLTELHNLFYKDGVKVIPEKFVYENLDELSLLVWICDDGYYNKDRDYIAICTENFNYHENVVLLKSISKLLGNVSLIKHSNKRNTYRIYINSFSNNKSFIANGLNILPSSMHYKISPVLNEHQVATRKE